MSVFRIHKVICITFFVLIFSHTSEARDAATLQASVSFARTEVEKAKAEHEANVQTVTQQQQIIEERKKQLANDVQQLGKAQKNAVASKKRYLEAQKRFENAQSRLDEAWSKK